MLPHVPPPPVVVPLPVLLVVPVPVPSPAPVPLPVPLLLPAPVDGPDPLPLLAFEPPAPSSFTSGDAHANSPTVHIPRPKKIHARICRSSVMPTHHQSNARAAFRTPAMLLGSLAH
jgi:hypothetical protein